MDSFVPKFINEKICNLLFDFLPTETLVVKTHPMPMQYTCTAILTAV